MLVEYHLSVQEMDMATQVQILAEAVYISHSANILGKGMHPTMGK